jgi:hypothetical protein
MSNTNSGSQAPGARGWMIAAALAGIVAIGLGALGVVQSKEAKALAESLAAAQQHVAETEARLKDAETKLVAATEQLKSNEGQLAEVSKPDLPVSVSFRAALLGSGLVAIFKNNGAKPIEVAAEFTSTVTGTKRSADLVLEPNLAKQIGHAEGWPFAAGQHIRLTNNQFRPAEYEVPGT